MTRAFHYHEPMKFLLRQARPSAPPSPIRALCVAALSLLITGTGLPATAQETAATEPVVNSRLDAPLFYQLLLGELSVRGGDPGAGYTMYLDAARRERNPDLYRRAVEIALQGRSGESALSAARAWVQDQPKSADARRFVFQILLALNRPGDTAPVLQAIVKQTPAAELTDTINAIPQAFSRVTDKATALQQVRKALDSYTARQDTGPAAWTTIGRMALAGGQTPLALQAASSGLQLDPASPYPALLALELLERGNAEAEPLVRRHLDDPRRPASSPIPLAYARVLMDMQRAKEASALLQEQTKKDPNRAEPWLLLATLQYQDKAFEDAKTSVEHYLAIARQAGDGVQVRGMTQAYLLMAQLAEKQGDFDAANQWLDRIENSQDIMLAQMRRASVLAKQGRMDEARALLRAHPERVPDDARLKLVAEAQLLRDFKAWPQAYEVYDEAVARFPDDTDLLYDQAMVAEKAGKLDDMERLLRRLIELRPDNHHAYNALGYALADRNVRLTEAKTLIEKAVSMAPDDAYIQDSLAWVEYRLGNVPRALEILQAAYRKRPDAEIAAHLGEVLWVAGRRDDAMKIWREGLMLASDNETLQSTLQRLKVSP